MMVDTPGPKAAGYRLHVALVHNHNADRNAYLIPRLQDLCAELDASLRMVAWQPALVPHSIGRSLYRLWLYYRFKLAWARYRGFGLKYAINITRLYLVPRLFEYFSATRRNRLLRMSRIETFVTAKHIAAWQSFIETDATHMFCCEDDLIFRDDSARRLRDVLQTPATPGFHYIDVAGGFAIKDLMIDRLVKKAEDDRILYDPATTNTACGYLLSRDLVAKFLELVADRPDLRLVGIDWMINGMLMIMRTDGVPCDALHFTPPIFAHGTYSGDYVSWMINPIAAPEGISL